MMRQLRTSFLVGCFLFLVVIAAGCAGTAVTPEDTSVPMTLYQSTEHGFSIEYPEGWAESPQGAGTQFSIDFTDPEGLLTVSVGLQYECQEITRADFVSQNKTYLESTPQYQLISESDISVGEGISGYQLVATGDLGTGKVEKFQYVLVVRGKQGLWIGVRGVPTNFDQEKQIVDAIMDSFKLLPTYTFAAPEPWPGGAYTGAGFTITFPAGWCQYPPVRPEHILQFAAPERTPSVHIALERGPADITLAEYVDNVLEGITDPAYWANFHLVSRRQVTVGGTPACELVFTGMSDLSPGYTNKCKYLIVPRGDQAYWVMAASSPGSFQEHESVITEIIYSFRLR